MPLVEGGDGDYFRSDRQSCLQGRVVVTSIDPVPGVVVVPGPNSGVHIPGADAGNEQQVICVTEGLDGLPVLVRGAKGEAVGGEVGVHAVEAAGEDVVLVALLDDESDENPVVRRASDVVGALRFQELRPGLGRSQVGVVDIKQRQDSPCAGPESVEGVMFSITEGEKAKNSVIINCM